MNKSDFHYLLPQELIAQHPSDRRDGSRLLVLDRETGDITHRMFRDIGEYFRSGDCLVLNDTRVIPARLLGNLISTGGRMEIVLLEKREKDIWEVLVNPGKKAPPSARVSFGNGILEAQVLEVLREGNRLVRFFHDGIFEDILDQVGTVPLPPYITEKLHDPERYQTVYAMHRGSAAAPTAGLHFTQELLQELRLKGVETAKLTLHVGLGSFRPVRTARVEDHVMHSEYYRMPDSAAKLINQTKAAGGRIIAVGTTSVRVLESVASEEGNVSPFEGHTDLFIYPGFRFRAVDGLLTNFHLPESTLLMLVSAFAGRERVMEAYRQAVEAQYRFFSFGDAMLIVNR